MIIINVNRYDYRQLKMHHGAKDLKENLNLISVIKYTNARGGRLLIDNARAATIIRY